MQPYQIFNSIEALPAEAIADLQAIFKCEISQKGNTLPEFAQQNKVLWVETGLLRAYDTYNGQEITTWFVDSNQFLYSAPADNTAQASYAHIEFLTKTTYHTCRWHELEALYLKYPVLNQAGRVLMERLLRRYNHVLYLLRVLTAAERLAYFKEHYPGIHAAASYKYTASFLGVTPEHLSRLNRKELENAQKSRIS